MLLILFLFLSSLLYASEKFTTIVLGCGGGPYENNVSSYLVAPLKSDIFIALDAGTLLHGISIAHQMGSFHDVEQTDPSLTREGDILRNHIKAYVISHAHLDHVAGLVINSQVDSKKNLFATETTIEYLKTYLFNGKIWPNIASEGKKPRLNQYHYRRLKLNQKRKIPGTKMTVEAYRLSHPDGYPSTAFLVEHGGHYLLYCGDTSPDALEPKKRLKPLWERVAPLIKDKKLHAIFLECSYMDAQIPESEQLFGHLEPKYMLQELHTLASLVNPQNPNKALAGFPVIVTHIKEALNKDVSAKEYIMKELSASNDLNVNFIFPEQGQKLQF